MRNLYIFLALACATPLFAQTPLSVPTTHFGVDSSRRMLLVQLAEEALPSAGNGLSTDDDNYRFVTAPSTLDYTTDYPVTGRAGDTFMLSFTPLPLVKIEPVMHLNQWEKRPAAFTYADGEEVVRSDIGVRHRGGWSLRYPKKSLDLEFRRSEDWQETRDVQFGNMRDDDDWVIDALYNEPMRVNAYLAHKVWLDLHQLSYQADEPEARAGADVEFIEVFFDGQYYGLCTLGEQVDRKQLKLKKMKDGVVRGALFKSNDYTKATGFWGVPDEAPRGERWAGWEVKHPEPDEVDWEQLRSLIRFAITTDTDYFRAEAAAHFDLDNTIDYTLFVNALRLTDNLSKNVYLARYRADSPYFFVPWDMDAGLGNKWDGTRIDSPTGWAQTHLLARLAELSPNDYADRLCGRLEELQTGILNPDTLIERLTSIISELEYSGAYRRESMRWPNVNVSADQLDYTTSLLRQQATFIANYACGRSTATEDIDALATVPLHLYPNPADDRAFVDLQGQSLPVPYRLVDRDGRVLQSGQMTAELAPVELQGLPGGMYFLHVGRRVARLVKAR